MYKTKKLKSIYLACFHLSENKQSDKKSSMLRTKKREKYKYWGRKSLKITADQFSTNLEKETVYKIRVHLAEGIY